MVDINKKFGAIKVNGYSVMALELVFGCIIKRLESQAGARFAAACFPLFLETRPKNGKCLQIQCHM